MRMILNRNINTMEAMRNSTHPAQTHGQAAHIPDLSGSFTLIGSQCALRLRSLLHSCSQAWCASTAPAAVPAALVLGDFKDDYSDSHTISRTDWYQRPSNRFHILRWNVRDRYLIARNRFDESKRGGSMETDRLDRARGDGAPASRAVASALAKSRVRYDRPGSAPRSSRGLRYE